MGIPVMLLTSVASQGRAPYKTVLTHALCWMKGRKMSKMGNVVDPRKTSRGGNQKLEPGTEQTHQFRSPV